MDENTADTREFLNLCSLFRHQKYEEAQLILEQADCRISINQTDALGNTLLHIAVQNGNKRLAKMCLRKGANINKQNQNGQTVLHFAFGFGFTALGEYLISKGGNDSLLNAEGLTCYEGLNRRQLLS